MIKRIQETRELTVYIKSVEELFKKCFGAPPWREVFNGNLPGYFQEILEYQGNISLLYFLGTQVIGASFSFPLEHKEDLKKFSPAKVLETIYLAEIFVDPQFQGRGHGEKLHLQRLEIAKKEGFKLALQRTSPASKMFPLILKTGFHPIAGMEVESLKRVDGHEIISPDARVISLRQL